MNYLTQTLYNKILKKILIKYYVYTTHILLYNLTYINV